MRAEPLGDVFSGVDGVEQLGGSRERIERCNEALLGGSSELFRKESLLEGARAMRELASDSREIRARRVSAQHAAEQTSFSCWLEYERHRTIADRKSRRPIARWERQRQRIGRGDQDGPLTIAGQASAFHERPEAPSAASAHVEHRTREPQGLPDSRRLGAGPAARCGGGVHVGNQGWVARPEERSPRCSDRVRQDDLRSAHMGSPVNADLALDHLEEVLSPTLWQIRKEGVEQFHGGGIAGRKRDTTSGDAHWRRTETQGDLGFHLFHHSGSPGERKNASESSVVSVGLSERRGIDLINSCTKSMSSDLISLDEGWLAAIDAAAPRLLGPHDRTGDALSIEVARLSELYTRDRGALRTQSAALAARLRFFLPRDLPKIEGPLSELAWAHALPSGPRLRVLDLGAGLGTTTFGLATFARRSKLEALDVLAIERDARSLSIMRDLASQCGRGVLEPITVPITLETRELDLERIDLRALRGPYDLVLIGLALNELWTEHPEPIERRAMMLTQVSEILSDSGAVIVIEPALRESSRALQMVRDKLVARDAPPHVFAPCTHVRSCAMLENERDWCHEDRPVQLPKALQPIARGAGLRFEGLSYSYLTLRRQPGTLAAGAHRIVGGPIVSKGRTEWHACGPSGLLRIARLDRHKNESDSMQRAQRGSLVEFETEPSAGETLRTDRVSIHRRRE